MLPLPNSDLLHHWWLRVINILSHICPTLAIDTFWGTIFKYLSKTAEIWKICKAHKILLKSIDLYSVFQALLWPIASALVQYVGSSCCDVSLSSSCPADSRSGLVMWCWILFFKGVPDPVSLPSQNSLGYWFSSYVCQYLLTFVDVDLLLVGAVSKCRPKSSNDEMGNFYLTLLISWNLYIFRIIYILIVCFLLSLHYSTYVY